MLIPNNKQKTKLFQCFGVSRFTYNWTLGKQQENYKNGGKFISDNDLRKEFTQLKKTKEYKWLNQYSNNISKQAIKDACNSYKKFFIDRINYPDSTTFKSRLLFILDSLDYTTIKSILVVNDDEIEESKSNFSKMIVDTRNYITHKDNSNIKPTVIMDRVQLLVASYQLGLIIIILIAKFIGLDEAIITDKVKQSNMQHIVSNNIKK